MQLKKDTLSIFAKSIMSHAPTYPRSWETKDIIIKVIIFLKFEYFSLLTWIKKQKKNNEARNYKRLSSHFCKSYHIRLPLTYPKAWDDRLQRPKIVCLDLFPKFECSSVPTLIRKKIRCDTAKDYITIFVKYIIIPSMICPQT